MSDRNKDVVPGRRAPVLSRVLLERIHELNRDYVELMLVEGSLPAVAGELLPSRLHDALGKIRHAGREAIAACPYTLFTLSFDDHRFWTAALDDSGEHAVEERYGMMSSSLMQAAFCEIALFMAWHTAQSQRLAARLLFGMPDTLVNLLADAPLWKVRRVALDFPGLLAPRWPRNPAFWPDLIRFADAGDARLEAARLLGTQLIAAELDGTLPRTQRQRAAVNARRQR